MEDEEYWKKVVKKLLPESIVLKKVFNIKKIKQTMFVQIYDNEIYLSKPISEERHLMIVNQIKDCLKKYKINNTIFAYNTMDMYPRLDDFVFTHSIIDSIETNNILAPCFTFDSYPERKSDNFVKYEDTYENITREGGVYMESPEKWNRKENNIVFVGSLTENNYRKNNTNFSKKCIVSPIIKNLSADSGDKFVNREDLVRYKYLLHLNGNSGAYSSRLKYLLLTDSLVFYITKYYSQNLLHREFWMYGDDFNDLVIFCDDMEDCEKKISYYHENKEISYSLCKNARDFCSRRLNKNSVLLYWKVLLNSYTDRFDEKSKLKVNKLIFKHKV